MSNLIEVELETMAHGGSALGRWEGQVVFVPYTIPGERVQAHILNSKGRTHFAQGVTLLESSADRVFPACGHFGPGRCGGCQWQHMAYAAQCLLKQDVLADQLERIGGFSDPPVAALIPSPAQWQYRMQTRFAVTADGQLALEQAEPVTSGLQPIDECLILHPELLALKSQFTVEQLTGVTHLTLMLGDAGTPLVMLEMADDQAPELSTDLPMSINLLLDDGTPQNLIGDMHCTYTVGGKPFRVTAASPFPANRSQVEPLIHVIVTALDPQPTQAILHLDAGIGLFSAFLAERVKLLTVVEADASAIADLEVNLEWAENVDVIEGAAEDVLPILEDTYDAVLLTPPESGLSTALVDGLGALAIPRVVYWSSDPATLARDGKRLAAQGYHLLGVQPLDLHPQTYRVDAVAVFGR
jgi:23S rRNA (uracil1939-C5)-methyltransferase